MKIAILGTGNVATQLKGAFVKAGHDILQVYGKNIAVAQQLAKHTKSGFTNNIKELNPGADIYIIAVTDTAIRQVAGTIPFNKKLIVHTSGSVSMDVFKNKFKNFGVLYPVQTILKKKTVNFKRVPFCLEASNEASMKSLFALAGSLSSDLYFINSAQRATVHLSAVFANNFSNHLFTIAERILSEKNISFELLKPLISETVKKIKKDSPGSNQTGPASRNDKDTLKRHIKMLENKPLYKKIYKDISESILRSE